MMAQVTLDMALVSRRQTRHGVAIDTLIAERERDTKKAAALARARRKHAANLEDDPALSLTRLRLAKGWSQTQLAHAIGTQQPYIARIERGDDDLKMSTMEKIAQALGVPASDIFQAVATVRARREDAL